MHKSMAQHILTQKMKSAGLSMGWELELGAHSLTYGFLEETVSFRVWYHNIPWVRALACWFLTPNCLMQCWYSVLSLLDRCLESLPSQCSESTYTRHIEWRVIKINTLIFETTLALLGNSCNQVILEVCGPIGQLIAYIVRSAVFGRKYGFNINWRSKYASNKCR